MQLKHITFTILNGINVSVYYSKRFYEMVVKNYE